MCGLVGAVALRGAEYPPDRLERLAAAGIAALAHRGPDDRGVWSGRGAALGHARLAIIDLEGGRQPLRCEDEQVVLVLNGELYDHRRLRSQLQAAGHRFRTRSDSEVALHLYKERGLDFVKELRGEFALLLWDARQQRLIAARDRFGIKPLCYARQAELLLLGSEAKALLAMGHPAAWDTESAAQVLSLQYLLPEQTLFAGIRQVPPGHFLLMEGGKTALHKYWDLDYPLLGRERADDETALGDALMSALDEAVQLRLQAEVKVAALLSGGLDSSIVAGLAARAVGKLTCFSVSFPGGAEYDEQPVATRTAAAIGAELHVVSVPPRALWETLPAAVAAGEGLAINLHIAAKYLLAKAVRAAGFKVLLTGEGADELLGGYAHLRRDYLLFSGAADEGGLADRAGTLVTAGVHLPEGASLSLAAVAQRLGAVPSFLQAKGTLGLRLRELWSPEFTRRFAQRDAAAELLSAMDVDGQLVGRHPVDQAAYLWTKLALAGYILRTLGDAMEMAHGVEGRVPFLDDKVFAAAHAAAVGVRLRGGIEKKLLRAAATRAGVVTAEVAARPKHPFMAPPTCGAAAGKQEELADNPMLQDLLRSGALESVPFFSAARVRALLDRLPKLSPRERVATDPVLMLVLTTILLQKHYRLGTAQDRGG